MGGNLIDVPKIRFSGQKYFSVQQKVLKVLKEIYEHVCSPLALPEKHTFGDVDFQVVGQTLPKPILFTTHPDILSKQVIITKPESSMSFECDDVQVDIKLYHSKLEYENDYILMSMGGIGNMLGYALKALGLKWNLHGLFYVTKVNDMNKSFLLLCDSTEITSFLGLDFPKISNFKSDDQVFKHLCGLAPLCYDVVYQRLEHICSKSLKDDKIRPSVFRFLQYYLAHSSHMNIRSFVLEDFQQEILSKFPIVMQDVQNQISISKRQLIVKSKFNGKIVSDILSSYLLTSFEGMKLGKFTASFRSSFPSLGQFEDFIISQSQDEIQEYILVFYKTKYNPET